MKTCHFNVRGKCALNRGSCCFCSHHIKDIDGIYEMKDYINIVTTRNNTRNALSISILALIISFLTLLLKIIESFGTN